jgi:methionyl-tRNA formyltransferase
MRVLFFGTSEFAVPSLEALSASTGHSVIAVVSQPDRPAGRGLRVHESPVKVAAVRLGLPVLQPKRVRSDDFHWEARSLAPDVLVLAAFGQIIPHALLDLPLYGPINIHGSLLPAYRGAAPIQHAILNGETVTGVTTMWMDATLDTGDVLLKRAVPVDPEDTAGTLTAKMSIAGAELLMETLGRLSAGDCPRLPQDNSLATYAPAISPDEGRIRWEEPAERIRNRIRAFSPRPGAFARFGNRRLKVWRARMELNGTSQIPGSVIRVGPAEVEVTAAIGKLAIEEVQAENSRRMSAGDWARGARVKVGDRFDS